MSQFAPTQPDTLEKQCRYFSIHRNIVGGITTKFTIKGRAGDLLGWVRWYGRWRMWCFLPCEGSVWSADCLADVCKFVAGSNARVPQNRDKREPKNELLEAAEEVLQLMRPCMEPVLQRLQAAVEARKGGAR